MNMATRVYKLDTYRQEAKREREKEREREREREREKCIAKMFFY